MLSNLQRVEKWQPSESHTRRALNIMEPSRLGKVRIMQPALCPRVLLRSACNQPDLDEGANGASPSRSVRYATCA